MRRSWAKVNKAFGQVLRSHREECGLSQEALALGAGTDRTFIWRLEKGRTQPSLALVIELAKVLEIDPAKLVTATVAGISGKG